MGILRVVVATSLVAGFLAGAVTAADLPAGPGRIDLAGYHRLAPEARAAYLAGVADGMALAAAGEGERARLLATCLAGFSPDQLGQRFEMGLLKAPWRRRPPDLAAAVLFAMVMAHDCQLQWRAPP